MRPSTKIPLAELVRLIDFPAPIWEFGALHVEEEQEVDNRGLFPGKPFIGVDFREGPGVDRVENIEHLSIGDGECKTLLCLDTLEHVQNCFAAASEIRRVLAEDGFLIFGVPFIFKIHGYPHDYWRFTPDGVRSLFRELPHQSIISIGPELYPHTIFGVFSKNQKVAGDPSILIPVAEKTHHQLAVKRRAGKEIKAWLADSLFHAETSYVRKKTFNRVELFCWDEGSLTHTNVLE